MSDEIRRMLQRQEELERIVNPYREISRHFEPKYDTYGGYMAGFGAAEALRLSEEGRLLAMGSGRSVSALKISDDLNVQRIVDQAKRLDSYSLGLTYENAMLGVNISAWEAAKISFDPSFRVPQLAELGYLAHDALASSSLARTIFESENALKRAMAGIEDPWVRWGRGSASARSLSEIIAMGRGIEALGAFDATYSGALRTALGDWRDDISSDQSALADSEARSAFYAHKGMDPELTDFPRPAFDDGLRLANLGPGADSEYDHDEADVARAVRAFETMRRFEIRMRLFIDTRMTKEFGDKWIRQQLPNGMLDEWKRKRAVEVSNGGAGAALIDYADFTEYKSIIERKDNWSRVFQPIFRRIEDVRESFQRLQPVRIAIMHARSLSQDDELLLAVETRRVLSAIDRG